MSDQTKEPQYQILLEQQKSKGLMSLGLMSSQVWRDDPKRLAFVLSRYKFVAKMLSGMRRVLEVGCADAFGTRIVQHEVGELVATDFDPVFVRFVNENSDPERPFLCKVHDMVQGPLDGNFDAVFALDVLEHIPPADEDRFLKNLAGSIAPQGVCILGSPSLESQPHASAPSKAGHVNCKSGADLKQTLHMYFHNVFVFSMNDEVIHTGFYPMAHYLFALCCYKR